MRALRRDRVRVRPRSASAAASPKAESRKNQLVSETISTGRLCTGQSIWPSSSPVPGTRSPESLNSSQPTQYGPS